MDTKEYGRVLDDVLDNIEASYESWLSDKQQKLYVSSLLDRIEFLLLSNLKKNIQIKDLSRKNKVKNAETR